MYWGIRFLTWIFNGLEKIGFWSLFAMVLKEVSFWDPSLMVLKEPSFGTF